MALEEERAYVDRALDLLEDGYHGGDEVDWPELRDVAHRRLDADPARVDSYLAIGAVLSRIGDAHNQLIYPAVVQQAVPERSGEYPRVERDGDVLIIKLPPVHVRYVTSPDYVRRTLAAIREGTEQATCGWIVDLREFTGGSMFHPLAVLGPVLVGQAALTLEHADGTVATAVGFDADGALLLDGLPAAEAIAERSVDEVLLPDLAEQEMLALTDLGPLPLPTPDIPIAVLTSRLTASSGEAVAVALEGRPATRRFGQATYGIPTGPTSYELEDGAVLRVATTRMVDRDGNAYSTSIPPDVDTSEPEADAAAWLEDAARCSVSQPSHE
ncbi:S41 family peptidase [Nitriliruptor alkaliphilus]|uniref:S41 family peptidase n=1 Tax=Nitriliruptor alkaliphilus TaxID=427918 RepID=UPI000698A44C|nr:S41 family peptidase [Nitriliruptor alkaliphilus]